MREREPKNLGASAYHTSWFSDPFRKKQSNYKPDPTLLLIHLNVVGFGVLAAMMCSRDFRGIGYCFPDTLILCWHPSQIIVRNED